MDTIREQAVVGRQGRLVIPARIREALSIRDGSRVTLEIRDGELHVQTVQASIDRARRILGVSGPPTPGRPLLSDELIADRRREAERETRKR